jgi:tripartite-type tricarboxylate transporter receptor subunit TctC
MFGLSKLREMALPLAGVALVHIMGVAPAFAAEPNWPTRPVTITVGFTPGGTTDIVTRMIAPALSKLWGQPIVVDNRPGAGGNIGGGYVAKQKADGYSLFMGSSGPLTSNLAIYKNMPYDTMRDFAPVSLIADVPNMLIVNPRAMPVKTFEEFSALIKAHPGKYFYGSTGIGTASHLSAELFKQTSGTAITHIPYKGSGALNDLLSGDQLHFMFATIPSAIQHVRGGKLRALAVTSAKRSPGVPELPTIAERGMPGFDAGSWYGLVAPAGTPKEIVDKISRDVAKVLAIKDIQEKLIAQGATPVGSTPEDFGKYMRAEITKWAQIVKVSGATAE